MLLKLLPYSYPTTTFENPNPKLRKPLPLLFLPLGVVYYLFSEANQKFFQCVCVWEVEREANWNLRQDKFFCALTVTVHYNYIQCTLITEILPLTAYPTEINMETIFLGTVIDSNIYFKSYLRRLCKKFDLKLLMQKAMSPFLDNKCMVCFYYTFFYPHLVYDIEFWGHASTSDLKILFVLQKAVLHVWVYVKPGKHDTSFFSKLKIMPLKMFFELRLLKLLLKTYSREEISKLMPNHEYNIRNETLTFKKANYNRGQRSLFCNCTTDTYWGTGQAPWLVSLGPCETVDTVLDPAPPSLDAWCFTH